LCTSNIGLLYGTDTDSAGWRYSAARRVYSDCLPTLGSASNYCSTLGRMKHACWARRAFDLRVRYPISYVRRPGASDDGISEEG